MKFKTTIYPQTLEENGPTGWQVHKCTDPNVQAGNEDWALIDAGDELTESDAKERAQEAINRRVESARIAERAYELITEVDV